MKQRDATLAGVLLRAVRAHALGGQAANVSDAAHRPFLIDAMGNVTHVVLRGGHVAVMWDVDAGTLLYASFGKLNRRALRAAAEQPAPRIRRRSARHGGMRFSRLCARRVRLSSGDSLLT